MARLRVSSLACVPFPAGSPLSFSPQVGTLRQLLHDMADEQQALKRRLRDQQLALASQQVSPRQVVIDLLMGRPTSLEQFRGLEQKLALLDTAMALSAGPAIVKVWTSDGRADKKVMAAAANGSRRARPGCLSPSRRKLGVFLLPTLHRLSRFFPRPSPTTCFSST